METEAMTCLVIVLPTKPPKERDQLWIRIRTPKPNTDPDPEPGGNFSYCVFTSICSYFFQDKGQQSDSKLFQLEIYLISS